MKTLFIVCGSPGAGKSTYATQLAQQHNAVLLDIDTVTERLVQLALIEAGHKKDDRDSTYFKTHFRQPIYDALFDTARDNLSWLNVVIVGPFTREIKNAQWLVELENTLGTTVEVHYVYCSPHIRRERLIERANPRDLAKLTDWPTYLRYYGDEQPPKFRHVYVDTSGKSDTVAST